MKYNIYIHHSTKNENSIGVFLTKDGNNNQVDFGIVDGGNSEYSVPVLKAAIKAVEALPQDAKIVLYYSLPTIGGKKVKASARELRSTFDRLVEQRKIHKAKISERDKDMLLLKRLVYHAKYSTKQNESTCDFIPDYIAFTDGSCNNLSPYGEGGAAYIILDGQRNLVKQNSKGFIGVTNNRMELMAILSAVAAVPAGSTLVIYTDSQYCIQVLTNKANANNFTRPNANVIRQYFSYASRLKAIRFEWVKGHDGDKYNEMVDALAQSRTEEMRTIHNIPVYDYRNSPKCRK